MQVESANRRINGGGLNGVPTRFGLVVEPGCGGLLTLPRYAGLAGPWRVCRVTNRGGWGCRRPLRMETLPSNLQRLLGRFHSSGPRRVGRQRRYITISSKQPPTELRITIAAYVARVDFCRRHLSGPRSMGEQQERLPLSPHWPAVARSDLSTCRAARRRLPEQTFLRSDR